MDKRAVPLGSVVSPVVVAFLWEGAVAAGLLRPAYLPPPSRLVPHLVRLLAGGDLWSHMAVTMERLGMSFALAVLPAVALGLCLGMWRGLRLALEPILTSLYAIPKIALLPLIMLVLGVGERALIFTATLTGFLQMTVSTMGGVLGVERTVLEAGRNYGATGWRLFRYVLLPSALPEIFTGMRIGLGLTLVLVIAVELTAAQVGLGAFLWTAGQTLSVQNLFAGFVVIGALGLILTYGLERLGDRLMPWRERGRDGFFV
ncbi:MAG: ABC transporter permease [Candidatus Tectomicrobia bacterium]|uniref:ABC transporter permease n=1 Tax=Tectimicrobiota bacterium TaxID=2528274 RepID=A0A932M1F0_UNCTE|nr:ABC transporter permease [Candidatus Tectomicrobia bacterium]